ncbi:unnamed protein product [Brachionus calyciflorus]|uniref:Ubiquitin-like protease family profile domain-containing protein n=1 Tax=Brachionus calyciflorus TaxID=104777 RepID=A0A814ISB0_9BILA|nr:unnamed protein product [Brachionus calyciflorus]
MPKLETKSSADKQWFDLKWGRSIDQECFVYDSLNDPSNVQVASDIFRLMFSEKNWENVNLVTVEQQVGVNDCGLFCIGYAQMLSITFNYRFDQKEMRQNYNLMLLK